jgi:hypothetical protein
MWVLTGRLLIVVLLERVHACLQCLNFKPRFPDVPLKALALFFLLRYTMLFLFIVRQELVLPGPYLVVYISTSFK